VSKKKKKRKITNSILMKIIESRHKKLLQFRIAQVVALSHFYSFGGRGKKSKVTFSGKTHQTIFIQN
jgi:hypothetical protein